MKLMLKRTPRETCTPGVLLVDGKETCYTLEDVVRKPGEKVFGETAIPAGTYRVVITLSHRFGRLMPLLLDVPNFSGVRIHSGNTPHDTEGCILVGDSHQNDGTLINSRRAFDRVFLAISNALHAGEQVSIEIA